MNNPRKTKPQAGRRGVSGSVGTDQGSNMVKDSPDNAATLCLALASMDAAREQLDRYALATDAPAWGVIEAADNLDIARTGLAEAMVKGIRHDPA